MEYVIIGLIVLFGLLNLGFSLVLGRTIGKIVQNSAYSLDQSIAQALKATVESLPLDMENQINPFQAFIMETLRERMHPALNVTEIRSKGEDGKFINDNL